MTLEEMRRKQEESEILEKRARIRREAEELRQLDKDIRERDFDCEPEDKGIPLDRAGGS